MSELFPVESVTADFPRLAWMKKHNLEIVDRQEHSIKRWRFRCWRVGGVQSFGFGETAEDAVSDYARANGLKLWNEE